MYTSRKKDSRGFEVKEYDQSQICEWSRHQQSLKEKCFLLIIFLFFSFFALSLSSAPETVAFLV